VTQNQAMNALVFLYKKVPKIPLTEEINAVRAAKRISVPVVMSRDEVRQIIALMEGAPQLIVKILYGSGLRIMGTVRLRVQDIDYRMKQTCVKSGRLCLNPLAETSIKKPASADKNREVPYLWNHR